MNTRFTVAMSFILGIITQHLSLGFLFVIFEHVIERKSNVHGTQWILWDLTMSAVLSLGIIDHIIFIKRVP